MPTLELGVQITLLVYKLFGGNPGSGRVPGEAANMFRYSGPRGAKVPSARASRASLFACVTCLLQLHEGCRLRLLCLHMTCPDQPCSHG